MKLYPIHMNQTIQNSTFQTNSVKLFLDSQFPHASKCFAEDMIPYGESIQYILVENWFKRYFPSNLAYVLFRKLKASEM